LLNDIEVQEFSNQTALQQAAITAQIAVLNQAYQLAQAKLDNDLQKQAYVSQLIANYNQLLLEINSLERSIASYEISVTSYTTRIALAKLDLTYDSTEYVDGLKDAIAEKQAEIDAKNEAIAFWKGFKVEDLEKSIAEELDIVNNTLRPALAEASEELAESLTSRDNAYSDLRTFGDSLKYFQRWSYSYYYDGEKYIYDYYYNNYTYYDASYSYPLHTDNRYFNYSSTADIPTKLVEAKLIAQVIAKDIEYLKADSVRDAKLYADTFIYYSNLGARYIAAKTALDNAAAEWQTAYNGYTATPQTVTEASFKIKDSTYCDKYAALYGGTAYGDGYQVRPNQSYYLGWTYIGKTYGVNGWSLNQEYYYLDNYVRNLKSNIGVNYTPTITSLTKTLASVNYLVSLLESNKLATYEAAYEAARVAYEEASRNDSEIYYEIDNKLTIIDELNTIALGYGKVYNSETGLLDEVKGYNVPDDILTTTIDDVKSYIETLETGIATLKSQRADKEKELARIAVSGDYQNYPPNYWSELQIRDLEATLAYYKEQLRISEGQKTTKETEAAALKTFIENAFKE
jgi:hypothetical protein